MFFSCFTCSLLAIKVLVLLQKKKKKLKGKKKTVVITGTPRRHMYNHYTTAPLCCKSNLIPC